MDLVLEVPRMPMECACVKSSACAIFYIKVLISYLQGSVTSTGLVVTSKLPRFSDLYTLSIVSADPKSISAGKPVEFTKTVTQWYVSHFLLLSFALYYPVFSYVIPASHSF